MKLLSQATIWRQRWWKGYN